MCIMEMPRRLQTIATLHGPSAFTRNASSRCVSHASTLVNATALTTASGCASSIARAIAAGFVMSASRWVAPEISWREARTSLIARASIPSLPVRKIFKVDSELGERGPPLHVEFLVVGLIFAARRRVHPVGLTCGTTRQCARARHRVRPFGSHPSSRRIFESSRA